MHFLRVMFRKGCSIGEHALDSVAHWWFKRTRVAVIGVGTVLDIAVKFVSPRVNPTFVSCHAYACLAHLSCCEQET